MNELRLYARVSTNEQNLIRQIIALIKRAEQNDGSTEYIGSPEQFAQRVDEMGGVDEYKIGNDTYLHCDKSTGTDTNRSAYRTMMTAVNSGTVSTVVAHSVSRVARSISDLSDTADRITENGADLVIQEQNLEVLGDGSDPYQKALFQLLGVFAELEAEIKRQNTREGVRARMNSEEDYSHGPAPLGFEKDDGHLVQGPTYHDVVATLDMVQNDELSKRKAADQLNTSRKSIYRALDRPELYGLNGGDRA